MDMSLAFTESGVTASRGETPLLFSVTCEFGLFI